MTRQSKDDKEEILIFWALVGDGEETGCVWCVCGGGGGRGIGNNDV